MNLLHLTSWFPFPPDTGGRIDSINFARALGKEHQVTLVCFSEQTPSEEALAALKPYYHAIHTIPLTKQDIIKSLLLSFITPLPINIQKYKSVKMQRFLETLVKSKSFDFVRIDHLHMSHYRDCFKGIPTILRKQNIDATIMRRYYEQQTNPVVKTLARQQYRKLLQFEKQASLAFQNCVMITHEDASQLETMSPGVHTSVIPCGIDLSDYSSIHQRQPEPYRITYLGSMDWSPNEDAVIYFLQDIWPRVKSHYPQAEFYIVGRNPTKRVRELARQPGIIVTGYVEDIKPYLEKNQGHGGSLTYRQWYANKNIRSDGNGNTYRNHPHRNGRHRGDSRPGFVSGGRTRSLCRTNPPVVPVPGVGTTIGNTC